MEKDSFFDVVVKCKLVTGFTDETVEMLIEQYVHELGDSGAFMRDSERWEKGSFYPDGYEIVDFAGTRFYMMDEWADDLGRIAPETYEAGFAHSMLKYFVYQIDPKFRMPLENVHYPTTENIGYYSKMITEIGEGGADICSSSPGWTGHMAFIDPVPEFFPQATGEAGIEEWLNMEARLVKLHPLTVAQNSLHGVFGQSGYIADVPPKAATIGPVDVKNARERIEVHALLTNGTFSSWQRMTSRLVLHGPVTPAIPSSMLQLMKTQVYVSEEIAAPFDCWALVALASAFSTSSI